MSRQEYTKRYYERHKEEILRKQKERHKKTYIPKKEGWTKPESDEERKERIKEARKRVRMRQCQEEKELRAKNEDELTETE